MNITSRFKALLLIGGMLFCVFASAEQVVSHTGSVDMTEQTTTGSLENDIFFKADFDGDMLFIAGEGIECKLPEDGCCPGKFGRGYHF